MVDLKVANLNVCLTERMMRSVLIDEPLRLSKRNLPPQSGFLSLYLKQLLLVFVDLVLCGVLH